MRGVNKRALDTYIVHFKHEGGEHSEKKWHINCGWVICKCTSVSPHNA